MAYQQLSWPKFGINPALGYTYYAQITKKNKNDRVVYTFRPLILKQELVLNYSR